MKQFGEKWGSNKAPLSKLITIKCECGFEIPLTSKLHVLSAAIDAHVEEHRKKESTKEKGDIKAKRVEDKLIRALFDAVDEVTCERS